MKISFIVPGPPCPLKRARVTTIAGHARMYDPTENVSKKAEIAWLAKKAQNELAQANDFIGPLLDGPLRLTIRAYMERPKSAKKRLYPTVKPDLDNIVKMIKDALNKVLYGDDSQIVTILAHKHYAVAGTMPRTLIELEDVE